MADEVINNETPAEVAPEIAANATPPTGKPPVKPPAGDFMAMRVSKMVDPTGLDEVDQLIPDEPGPSLPPLTSEEDKAMFGTPTFRPNEPVTAGVTSNPYRRPIPKHIRDAVPLLRQMATRPDAPDELKQMLIAIAREMR